MSSREIAAQKAAREKIAEKAAREIISCPPPTTYPDIYDTSLPRYIAIILRAIEESRGQPEPPNSEEKL